MKRIISIFLLIGLLLMLVFPVFTESNIPSGIKNPYTIGLTLNFVGMLAFFLIADAASKSPFAYLVGVLFLCSVLLGTLLHLSAVIEIPSDVYPMSVGQVNYSLRVAIQMGAFMVLVGLGYLLGNLIKSFFVAKT